MFTPSFQEGASYDEDRPSERPDFDSGQGHCMRGLTSKIPALVDTNGLPVRLALTAGEAHDNRLVGKLLSRLKSGSMLLADRGYDADWIRALATERALGPTSSRDVVVTSRSASVRISIVRAIWVERLFHKIKQCRRVATTTNSRPTIWPSSTSHQYGCGCALISPRPRTHQYSYVGLKISTIGRFRPGCRSVPKHNGSCSAAKARRRGQPR
ncbi:transposase [Nitrobacteraceae bacterium AZCC 2146]